MIVKTEQVGGDESSYFSSHRILHLGSAFLNSATFAELTPVFCRLSADRLWLSLKSAAPASVTRVSYRSSSVKCSQAVNKPSCPSPTT
jgi:hypothetical protein